MTLVNKNFWRKKLDCIRQKTGKCHWWYLIAACYFSGKALKRLNFRLDIVALSIVIWMANVSFVIVYMWCLSSQTWWFLICFLSMSQRAQEEVHQKEVKVRMLTDSVNSFIAKAPPVAHEALKTELNILTTNYQRLCSRLDGKCKTLEVAVTFDLFLLIFMCFFLTAVIGPCHSCHPHCLFVGDWQWPLVSGTCRLPHKNDWLFFFLHHLQEVWSCWCELLSYLGLENGWLDQLEKKLNETESIHGGAEEISEALDVSLL